MSGVENTGKINLEDYEYIVLKSLEKAGFKIE